MKQLFPAIVIAGAALLVAAAQDSKTHEHAQDHGSAEAPMGIPVPRPAPQHQKLAERIGTWEADLEMWMGGPEPMRSKGTMTYEAFGPFWIVGRYEAEMMGMPFQGMDLTGWDDEKKEFVSYWIDTAGPASVVSRGTWDEGAKAMVLRSRERNMMTGQMEDVVHRTEFKGPDELVFTMRYESASDPMMRVVYKRKK